MKSNTKKISESELEVEIELSFKELEAFIEKAVLEAQKDLEVEGFRKGKAPKNIVEEKVGKENLLVNAADLAIRENFKNFIIENKIELLTEPEIDILKIASGNPFIFRAKLSVLPEITLPDYKQIAAQVKRNKVLVQENEIEGALTWLSKSRAKFILKNDKAEKGDFVEIEYSSPDISELKEVKKDSFILGDARFIPGFEEQIIGSLVKEEKEFSLDIPENHQLKNSAGKKVKFKLKIISVQKVEFPEINDEFAKSIGDFKNLEALKNNIKEGINIEKEQAESQRIRAEILEKIGQKTRLKVPQKLIENEQNKMLEEFKNHLSATAKVSFQDYLKNTKKTEKEIKDTFVKEAETRAKNFLILKEISKKEKIETSKEEIEQEMDKILKNYPDIEKAKKDIDSDRLKIYTELVIRNEKTFKLLESFIK